MSARAGLNELVRKNTAWCTFDQMVKAALSSPYRPTLRVDTAEQKRLADVFDAAMRRAGHPEKQAERYGSYSRRNVVAFQRIQRPVRDVGCIECGGTYKSAEVFALAVCPSCLPAWQKKQAEAARERDRQREEWRRQGLHIPYGYDKPVELGGRCWDCEADWGGHKSWCQAVN